jgi:FtsZ-interacting cell division protein ZipA
MDTWVWIVIAVVVAIVVLGILATALRTRRSRSLQDRFGREYDRTVDKAGGRREAEQELREREKRHDELELRPLSQDVRERYLQQWQVTQGQFVDDPKGAMSKADDLVQRVMRDRGYPVDDFEQRAADISVEHPDLVEKYRTANGIARASERGEASTEDLRHSVRHYRALFVELLEVGEGQDAFTRDGEVEEVHAHDNVERLR